MAKPRRPETEPSLAWARATVHLPGGLVPGEVYRVDVETEYVAHCLRAGFLVLVLEPEERETP